MLDTSSIAHFQFLGLGRQLCQNLEPSAIIFSAKEKHVLEPNPAVRADLVKGNLALLEQANQGRARNAEHIGSLLGGQGILELQDRQRVAWSSRTRIEATMAPAAVPIATTPTSDEACVVE